MVFVHNYNDLCTYETTLHVTNNENNTHLIYCIILYICVHMQTELYMLKIVNELSIYEMSVRMKLI